MLLNDRRIKELVQKHPDFISPFVGEKVCQGELPSWGLEPHGYTFRLHPQVLYTPFVLPQGGQKWAGGITEPALLELDEGDYLVLPPFTMLHCRSIESFKLPNNIVGLLTGKSTYTRQGIVYCMTVVDAGYEGVIYFALANLNPIKEVKVYPYGGIGQIMFVESEPADVAYLPSHCVKETTAQLISSVQQALRCYAKEGGEINAAEEISRHMWEA